MANKQHLDILKQGVEVWNGWRKEHHDIVPDLSGAILDEANLNHVRFSFSRLSEASFRNAQLRCAYFVRSDLSYVNFSSATLNEAHLDRAKLNRANLSGARLRYAKICQADLSDADLSGTDLSFANLDRTSFSNTNLYETDFSFARLRFAEFFNVDLSSAKGLDTIIHGGSSHLGIQALSRSLNNLSGAFLQGTGTPDSMLAYARSLDQNSAIYATCLLTYTSPDETFAQQLQTDLQAHSVLCMSLPYDIADGEISALVCATMSVYDILIVVTSEHSGIGTEATGRALYCIVKDAFAREQRGFVPFLLPIHLDRPPQHMPGTWARLLRLARHQSRDFTRWNDPDAYRPAFEQLLGDLRAEEGVR